MWVKYQTSSSQMGRQIIESVAYSSLCQEWSPRRDMQSQISMEDKETLRITFWRLLAKTAAWVNWVKATTPILLVHSTCCLGLAGGASSLHLNQKNTRHTERELLMCAIPEHVREILIKSHSAFTLNNYCPWQNCRKHLFFSTPSFKYPYPWYSKCEANFVPAKPRGRNVLIPELSIHHLKFLSEGPDSSIPFILSSCQSGQNEQLKKANRKRGRRCSDSERAGVVPAPLN